MKGKIQKIIIIMAIITAILCGIVYFFFFSMGNLPKGEYLKESTSPNGKYSIRAYLCNSGATTGYAVRCEIIKDNGKAKNIYWDYKIQKAEIIWEKQDVVIINGHRIELPYGKYDFRHAKR